MSSILTNSSAMVALQTLNMVTKGLTDTQNRVSTGLQISSGKDNASYFAISETMKSDSGMFKAIDTGLTATKNSVETARLGATTISDIAAEMSERIAFAQANGLDMADIQTELTGMTDRMQAALDQSTFNGDNLLDSTDTVTVTTGISRSGGTFAATSFSFDEVDVTTLVASFQAIDISGGGAAVGAALTTIDGLRGQATDAATQLGIAEKTIEGQKEFLGALTDTLDSGVSAMVDADMEEEAARLQAYQVQQQLATQSLSMANQAPQNILSLFR